MRQFLGHQFARVCCRDGDRGHQGLGKRGSVLFGIMPYVALHPWLPDLHPLFGRQHFRLKSLP